MSGNSPAKREEAVVELGREPLDLLIIGGGIVGAGIARDAAMRGLRTGLVEQHDFAFGTSSRSSRLLHGGLRYLAQGRLGLVREASLEKRILHHIAPHLAAPLPFIFPTYRGNRHWILWQLKIGVKIYDLLCGGHNLGNSSWLSRDDVREKVPGLTEEQLQGAVRYYDGFTNDARLTLDTLRSAAKAGASLLNYCRFKNATAAQPWRCEVDDQVTGASFTIAARAIVNATGPWAQQVPHSQVELRLTKGIHLVVDCDRLRVPETIVMTDEQRILFAIPWGDRTILGTTDTDYAGSLDDVHANRDDVQQVLVVTNRFFPRAQLTEADVVSTWAGLRPLIANANGKPSDISRAHEVRNPEPGWWDVAGGKLTTHRLMAEQTVDAIAKWLVQMGATSSAWQPCCTATEPLLPTSDTADFSGILPPKFSRAVVEHYVNHEWALHLEDILLRRTSWHYYFPDHRGLAEQTADCMGALLNWTGETRAAELARYARFYCASWNASKSDTAVDT